MLALPVVLQFILTILRLKDKVKIPIWLTFIISLTLEVLISIQSLSSHNNLDKPVEPRCDLTPLAIFGHLLLYIFVITLIGIIGGLLYSDKHKLKKQREEKNK